MIVHSSDPSGIFSLPIVGVYLELTLSFVALHLVK